MTKENKKNDQMSKQLTKAAKPHAKKLGKQAGGIAGEAVGARLGGPVGAMVGKQIGKHVGKKIAAKAVEIGIPMMSKGADTLRSQVISMASNIHTQGVAKTSKGPAPAKEAPENTSSTPRMGG